MVGLRSCAGPRAAAPQLPAPGGAAVGRATRRAKERANSLGEQQKGDLSVWALVRAGLPYFVVAALLLIALTISGTLAIMMSVGMQFDGFSVLATSLALFVLLLKGSLLTAGFGAVYTLVKGELPLVPALPSLTMPSPPSETVLAEGSALDAGVGDGARGRENTDPDLADWDRRFWRTSTPSTTKPRELVRFEELSPTSPFKQLRTFIAQEKLDIKTGGPGKTKAEVYKQIALRLLKR